MHALRISLPRPFLFFSAVVAVAASVGEGCAREVVPPTGPGCITIDECGEGRLCAAGACVDAPPCRGVDDWPFCRDELEQFEAGLGRTAICESPSPTSLDFTCRVACETDDQCSGDALCTDFGHCVPGLRRRPAGTPKAAHAPLVAGVGEALLDVPLSTSLGGFSSRAGPGDGAWADGMEPAVGRLEGLWARAALLDAGDGRVLFVRLPIIFPTAAMTEAIAQALQEQTGDDWRDALVVTGTHTHSGPARFLPLLGESEAVLGPFGIGTFRQDVFDRIVKSSVAAALSAIDAAQPARLGATVVEAYDTDDAIAHDRRDASPPFDDNRALLVRVDDEAGVPLFVITGFGIHATDNSSNWATNEVAGGVEDGLEAALYPVANRVVPVLFVNGAGGSMAPSAGGRGFAVPHGFAQTGHVYAERMLPTLLSLPTKADVVVRGRAHRFAMTNETVGYAPGEWTNGGQPPFGGDVTYGGLNCFTRDYDDDGAPYAGHLGTDEMTCGISFHTFLFNHPPSVFQRAQISALDLDGLAVVTLPGELTMELGWGIAAALQRQAGVDPSRSFLLGFANDHLMYLLPTTLNEPSPPWPGYTGPPPSSYPPFAFSPLRGGYEADTSIFGDKGGDALIREAVVAWQRLNDDAPASKEAAPAVYSPDVKPPIPVDDTPVERAGAIVVSLPASLARRTPTPLTFEGGDVAVEGQGPQATLLRDDGAPVLLPSGRPFSTAHALFPVSVARVDDGDGPAWRWTMTLELPWDLPAGSYHLAVTGQVQRAGVVVPYAFDTPPFTVDPAPLDVTAVRDGDDLVVRVGLATDEPTLNDRGLQGRLRLIDPRVMSGRLAPLPSSALPSSALPASGVRVTGDGIDAVAATVVEEVVDGDPATLARVPGVGSGALVVDIVDAFGNTGRVEVPAVTQ
ncbi:MAG: hypothetical protein FJ137_07015 [Deltaproteobacteria bacterium]|nr:hypothetical protein [Deltaproteobacteria bacterium]